MELLLNLAWLLLALPAYWLWRSAKRRSLSSRQCLLALVCVLTLLFPVISATDDLHAMRAEMEESGTGKRSVRQAGGEKSSAWTNLLHTPVAIATDTTIWTAPEFGPFEIIGVLRSPLGRHVKSDSGRAPPFLSA